MKKSNKREPNLKFKINKQAISPVNWLETQLVSPQDMNQTLPLGNKLSPLNEVLESSNYSGSPSKINIKD